ncbi:uncharacterized protein CC84DRAFT_381309 [Paraphaeosphaeria sporulosa]|uniref:Uncharacterized protein n=1 Tax=Paraphaeosphaeria sporulosa TaxID=1460663 RepID=A0A177BYQ2_9PLEO|nr:uncharacterized protein CC84DRAFT_381309 [Paraphaeosphaeria sporulosa]OAF99761.1 hypothetical protein CC84DRAFT_381309 [Paraphaeosphaeria sporulosa]
MWRQSRAGWSVSYAHRASSPRPWQGPGHGTGFLALSRCAAQSHSPLGGFGRVEHGACVDVEATRVWVNGSGLSESGSVLAVVCYGRAVRSLLRESRWKSRRPPDRACLWPCAPSSLRGAVAVPSLR